MLTPLLRRSHPLLLLCGASVGLLAPAEAAADKVSNAMAECQGKVEGAACALAGRKGACVARSFERPNGMSKRWVECSPGAKPDRKAVEQRIDAAGPVGVLPSVGAVRDEREPTLETGDPLETGATRPSRAKAEGSGARAEPPSEAPTRSAPTPLQTEPQGTPAGPPSAPPSADEDGSPAPANAETETRGGCRLDASEPLLGPALAGLLLIAGRRRKSV